MKHRLGLTPGTPRFITMRVTNEEDKLPMKEHAIYRSGVGTLIYLTKQSRPDISNAVRELSKTMDRPAPFHLKGNVQNHQICAGNKNIWTNFLSKEVVMDYPSIH